jgi:hypothetical protein
MGNLTMLENIKTHGRHVRVNGYTAFVTAGSLTMITDGIAGDFEDEYDMAQSFVGGGLSGLVGKNINKKITGGPKTFWDKWYGKGIAFGNESETWFSELVCTSYC